MAAFAFYPASCTVANIEQALNKEDDMINFQTKTLAIIASLAMLMGATRFSHFGSAVSLPDASYAVFFLGGLYLAKATRATAGAFVLLIIEAGLIDFYATSALGVSDWCMTTAYWFLIPTYGSLWLIGHWFALSHTAKGQTMSGHNESKALVGLALVAWAATSFAFVFSNATFYLFSEHFADMSTLEYATSVAQYYVSYVSVALLYIACAVALHMAVDIIGKQKALSH
jgi:hypothetical protein